MGKGWGRSAAAGLVVAAWAAGASADSRIIDSPNADPLGHATARWEIGAGPEGSVLSFFHLGVFDRVHFGLSYGLQEVLGSGPIDANPHVGFQAQVLVLDQQPLPTLALGFDSQGHGRWDEAAARYERKSLGFYGVASHHVAASTWPLLTTLSGGINYSLEGERESMDFFAGLAEEVGGHFGLLLDYDFGFDDREDADRGWLDLGLQWRFDGGSHVRFLLRDLLGNGSDGGEVGRELNFFYLFHL
ncbi:MAG TPA: hypothetical protein VFD07_06670 [Candidatus Krumholzibacteria bacterium]|nr:hypothetical protein [Candidatus Krumholzibacteria bacterium]